MTDYASMTKKERRSAWTAALRSGKYKQGTRHLHAVVKDGEDLFCCLGVACALFAKKEEIVSYSSNLQLQRYSFGTDPWSTAMVHLNQMAYLGLGKDDANYLVKMNDDQKKTFDEIADYIDGLEDAGDDI